MLLQRINYPPMVFLFHYAGSDGNFNCAMIGQPGGYLQCAISVLRNGYVIIKTILVQIRGQVAINQGQQPVAIRFVIPVEHQTNTDQIVNIPKRIHAGFPRLRHPAQFLPALPVSIHNDFNGPGKVILFHD